MSEPHLRIDPETGKVTEFTLGTAADTTVELKAPGVFDAWQSFTRALGRDLQGALWRAEQARRRIARGR